MRTKLSELRDALSALVSEMTRGDGASTTEIAEEFIRCNKTMLRRDHEEVQRVAIMQLINDVSKRRPSRSVDPGQGDLFGDYAGPQSVVIAAKGSSVRTRKSVLDLTIEEALDWVEGHRRARQREARDAVEIDSLVERAKPFCKEGSTIREGLAAAEQAEKKG